MTDSAPLAPTAPDPLPISRVVIIAALAASLMIGSAAISTQSYWIDEATSLIVAMSKNPAEAWNYAKAVGGSTIQMPLYHLYLYGWHKVFGGGEWAMRASNLPWFLLAQLAFLVLLRDRPRLALIATLLAAVSPTIWMYLDETRPYAMQYAAACWLIAAITRLSMTASRRTDPATAKNPDASPTSARGNSLPLIVLSIAGVILFGSSLLGIIWAGGFLLALVWLSLRDPNLADSPTTAALRQITGRQLLLPLAIFGAASAVIFAYYVWTWPMAGDGYHLAGTKWISLPYIAYEFLGFAGYGPGKIQLRSSVAGSLAQSIPALLPLGILIATLVVFVITQPGTGKISRRTLIAWALALVLPSLVIWAGFFLASYRPLPRHFIPALPAVFLALAAVLDSALSSKNIMWRAAAVLLPLLWLGSALNLRWRDVHAKDDYRTAAKIAAASLAENKEVWWAADAAAAYIYLTPVALQKVPGRAWAMQAPSWEDIRYKFPPRVIVISKPDIYDPQGSVARYAAENRFVPAMRLQAMTIFTREGDSLPTVRP